MIHISNIHKSFGTLEVLKGIDLHISRGEVVSIVGPSGAGKTTLLQVMGTLYRPDAGSLRIAGTDISTLSAKEIARFRNEHLGFVFQFHQLLPEFSALENVMIPAMIAGRKQRATRERALELLKFMGLAERADHKPSQLSGGEKQRVAVARALMNEPDVIFADEPSGSLDSHDRFGQTFVIVTHDNELARLTDRCIHIVDGKILEPEVEEGANAAPADETATAEA